MKVLIASDIHGSYKYAKKMIEIAKKEHVEKVILLGDILYHGPRNNLPKGFSPKDIVELLNSNKDLIVGVRGNCDAEIDLEVLKYPITDSLDMNIDGKNIHFEHGHHLKETYDSDVVFYGHYHVYKIEKINNIYFVNPGSVSLPKQNQDNSFAILDNNKLYIRNIKNKTLVEALFD